MHNFDDIPQSVGQIRIMVAGIGGAGLNALNAMLAAGLDGVETVGISCSVPRLRRSWAGRTLQIGSDQRGFGTGGNPAVARTAAEQSSNELRRLLAGVDLLLLTAGLGSGTGTGATPVVARLARESGALVVGLVTRPFSREGRHRAALARQGVRELLSVVDSLIVIPNDRLISQASRGMSLLEAFRPADQLLQQAVQGIVEVVTGCGHINVDFSDLRTVLAARGMALIGIGTASGENRAVAAATQAIANPLLEELDLSDARGLLLNISGSSSMTLDEYDQVCRTITEQLAEDAVMVVGMVLDASLADRISLNPFEPPAALLSTAAVISQGRVVVYEPGLTTSVALTIGKMLKAGFFKALLNQQRMNRQDCMPFFYICDEFQRFITFDEESGEQSFLDRCRAYRVCCGLATQSIASLRYLMSNEAGLAAIKIMMVNTGTKLFFRTTDADTAESLTTMLPAPAREGKLHLVRVRPPTTLRPGECYYLQVNGHSGRGQIRLAA